MCWRNMSAHSNGGICFMERRTYYLFYEKEGSNICFCSSRLMWRSLSVNLMILRSYENCIFWWQNFQYPFVAKYRSCAQRKRWGCYHCTFSAEVAASSSFHAFCIVHAGHSTVDSPSILLHKVEEMFKNSLCTLQILKVKVISVSVTNLLDVYSIFYPLPL